MNNYYNKRIVERKLREKLKDDRARIQFGRIGNFGLLEMTRQRLRESSVRWNMTLSLDSFALKIIKKSEELAFSNKAKIININVPQKVKTYIEENLIKEINHFKAKYKLEFNIISDNALVIPEYKIDLLNKNKKIIKKIENIEPIENSFIKQNYDRNKFANKRFVKKNKFKKKYNYRSKKKRNDFNFRKTAN
jgi:ribonuclease E